MPPICLRRSRLWRPNSVLIETRKYILKQSCRYIDRCLTKNLTLCSNILGLAWRSDVKRMTAPALRFWMLKPLFIWPKSVLSNAECCGQTLFTELNRAEASLGWMCERRATANEGVPDEDLVKPTDNEVEEYALKLVMRAHEEELRRLDEEI